MQGLHIVLKYSIYNFIKTFLGKVSSDDKFWTLFLYVFSQVRNCNELYILYCIVSKLWIFKVPMELQQLTTLVLKSVLSLQS